MFVLCHNLLLSLLNYSVVSFNDTGSNNPEVSWKLLNETHTCCRDMKPIQMWIQRRTANFTWRHVFEKSFFTTRQYLCWSTINRRLQLQLATSVSYQTFCFSIGWKSALETWRCQNQLHHSVAPLGSKQRLFFNQSFCSACDDDIRYAFAMPADLSGDWNHRDDRRCVFTMHDECDSSSLEGRGRFNSSRMSQNDLLPIKSNKVQHCYFIIQQIYVVDVID